MGKDILDEMTKQELILWVRRHVVQRPSKSDVLLSRWETLVQKQQQLMEADHTVLQKPDWEKIRASTKAYEALNSRINKLYKQYEAASKLEARRCCEHAGCDKQAVVDGLCQTHEDWWQQQGQHQA